MQTVKFSDLCGFFDKQWTATLAADTHKYMLYGGSRGPGKSYWLRWYSLRRLLVWAAAGLRNVRVGIFCESYPALEDRQISKIQTEFPPALGRLRETRANGLGFYLKPEYGGGIIALRNLDDPEKYQSAEFAGIAVDELTKNPERYFHVLRGSLRWPGVHDPFFVSASNPNGPGQKWARAYFVERNLPSELQGHEAEFTYVPASPFDNPHLDPSYWEMLNTLPKKLREAWLEGNWYVTMEGAVYEEFGAENITDEEPDPELPVELAYDDGYIDPRAFLFIQRKPTGVLVFAELYHSQHLEETCIEEAQRFLAACGLPPISIACGSPEAIKLRERFRKANISARGEKTPIVEGIRNLRPLILAADGSRPLKVHRRCQNLIGELSEGYQYPTKGTRSDNEVPLDKDNHAADALRYWAWLRARRL